MSGGSYGGGRSVMFKSTGQSERPMLQANVVRGPSPGPRPRSRSVSPSRGGGSSHMSTGDRGFVARGGYQNNGRCRGWNGTGRPVVMQRNIAAEETMKAVGPPVSTVRSSTPFASSLWRSGHSQRARRSHVYVLWTAMTLDDWCAERLANEAKTMVVVRGGTEMKASVIPPK